MGLVWSLFYFWINYHQKQLMIEQLHRQAHALSHYVVRTCRWISHKKGVYIKLADGTFDLYTPSQFSKSVSRFEEESSPFKLKIIRIKSKKGQPPLDSFEKDALKKFEKDKIKETWELEKKNKKKNFRYASPLYFRDDCMGCHQNMEMEKGLVGCISLTIPADKLSHRLISAASYYSFYFLATLAVILLLIWIMLQKCVLHPLHELNDAYQNVREGKLDTKLEIARSIEWQEVGVSFNQMVDSIANQQISLQDEIKKAVADLEKAYKNLKETQQYRYDFFSNITHDLRTPITAIKGATELLELKIKDGESAAYIAIVHRNIEKLSLMVQDLLDCAKLESGEFDLELAENDLVEIIEDAILMTIPIVIQKNIKFHYDVPSEPAMVLCDRTRMEQAISNIFSNAIKFSPPGKYIVVDISAKDNEYVILVDDYGPGIPESDWGKVFEKFFRRDNKTNVKGVGLGLAITKGIIEAHNGRVWISKPNHPGIVFNIAVPKAPGTGKRKTAN
jgi:signal transduction histidine kinase